MTREQIIGKLTTWAASHVGKLVLNVNVRHGRWYIQTAAGYEDLSKCLGGK